MSKNSKNRKARRRDRMTDGREWSELGPPPGTPINVIGSPEAMAAAMSGALPRMREATLEDCVDDCPLCQQMREDILAGNPPQIMAFD